ncbi:MAG: extracellular solute-binding protein [Bacteroides sp.]|nr:extracellular solute-binding protein [Bacteroides sp.]
MKNILKKLLAVTLAASMTLSLAACSENSGNSSNDNNGNSNNNNNSSNDNNGSDSSSGSAKADPIVVWTLSNDLKQFAERYTNETGNEVEVVVFDSADFKTKINQTLGTKSSDLDVFVGEPQMLPDFFEAGFSADLSEYDEQAKTRLADYTYQAGCDSDGVLRAMSYQSAPGSVIYRRDIAEKVFGTEDPDEIGKLFSSFDAIVDTAQKLQSEGYTVFGDTGALRWFSNSSSPWVRNNEIIVDQDRLDYFDCAVELYQKEYVAFAPEWSAAWYASMHGPLPMHAEWSALEDLEGNAQTEIFAYVMPAWGALIVRDNAGDYKGKYGVCRGVCGFFGGGTFLTVNEFSKHKDAAKPFIEYCTLNDDTARWWIDASGGDMIANKAVVEENKDFQIEFGITPETLFPNTPYSFVCLCI